MDTIFVNSANSKTSNRLFINLSDKINLKRSDKYVALSNLSIYHRQKKKKSPIKTKFKISAPTCNEEFKFSHGSYSV